MSEVRSAIATLVAAVGAAAAALGLAAAFGESGGLAITAVAVTFFASRTFARLSIRRRFTSLPVFAAIGVVAAVVGRLLVVLPPVGAALFILGAAATVWTRRFGPRGRRLGALAAAPFVSVLTVPIPVAASASGPAALIAVPIVSIAAAVLVAAALSAADLIPPRRASAEDRLPAAAVGTRRASSAPDRMALQMLVALTAAFLIGWFAFPDHWAWVVLTTYIAIVGGRGRGDVAVTVGLRLVGALGGAVVGEAIALLSNHVPAVAVAAILALLTVGRALRERSYVWWAAAITASLAILYSLTGVSGPTALGERLVAILVGGVIAVLAAWFVLPIRTRDVLRRRAADLLAAAGAAVNALRADPDAFAGRLRDLHDAADALRRSTRAHHMHGAAYAALGRPRPDGAAVAETLLRLPDAVRKAGAAIEDGRIDGRATSTKKELGAVERRIGDLRRVIGRTAEPDAPTPTHSPEPELAGLEALLASLRGPLQRLSTERVSPPSE